MANPKPTIKLPQLAAATTDVSQYADTVRNLDMVKRRQNYLGGSVLFYHEPVHLVRGKGVWLWDDQGKKYLDCYNNVASVGHCHSKVVAALSKQAKLLNTHTRYLHNNVIDYAEKLSSLMPDSLDVCMFVCTGTEANDLAMRLARAYTGNNGAIVMQNSYHGNSTMVDSLTTAGKPKEALEPYVVTVEPPNTYRGSFREGEHDNLGKRYADLVDSAIAELDRSGQGTAAMMVDTIFDTQGSLAAPKDYFQHVAQKIHAAGGLLIADEVQAGLCRTGKWWGFEHYDIVPDIVTLGKPMGDGHPLAVVVTRKEIVDKFNESSFYFNTFGGNPVSTLVGNAVLDVCEKERLVENCANTGAYFKQRLQELSQRQPLIGHVHGLGMFLGVELVHDRVTKAPASDIARLVPDAMKAHGILMNMTGPLGNVLKVRPPLIFTKANVDQVINALDRVLSQLSAKHPHSRAAITTDGDLQQIDSGVLTERTLQQLSSSGCCQLQVARQVVITPLAKDKAKALQIEITRV